ncbi:MAG: hypothetical protein GF313_06625 [Caldithrix sp.]|nr:hypothetical protein [Caldithrix sp.]
MLRNQQQKDEALSRQPLTEEEYEQWQERAAIMQYDGGLSKTEAESLALHTLLEIRNRYQKAG